MFYEFACDYNNFPLQNPFAFGMTRGPFSIRRNCFLQRDLSGKFYLLVKLVVGYFYMKKYGEYFVRREVLLEF